jgi:cell shape-determining protein MreD
MYSVLQQGGVVFLLVLAGECLRLLMQGLTTERQLTWAALLPAVTSLLVWPFLALLLTRLRLQFRVE